MSSEAWCIFGEQQGYPVVTIATDTVDDSSEWYQCRINAASISVAAAPRDRCNDVTPVIIAELEQTLDSAIVVTSIMVHRSWFIDHGYIDLDTIGLYQTVNSSPLRSASYQEYTSPRIVMRGDDIQNGTLYIGPVRRQGSFNGDIAQVPPHTYGKTWRSG